MKKKICMFSLLLFTGLLLAACRSNLAYESMTTDPTKQSAIVVRGDTTYTFFWPTTIDMQ